jgi:hypothetical protein
LIEEDSDCALYSQSQFLKSFVGIDIGYSVATGTKALGLQPVIEPGPVIYYAGEGYTDVRKRRSCAWEIAHHHDPYSVDTIIFGDGAPYVNQPETLAQQSDEVMEWLAGRPAKLTIIDTLNRRWPARMRIVRIPRPAT